MVPFLIKESLKIRIERSKIYLHRFLGSIVMHIHAKYRKVRMKTEGVYLIWKQKGWRADDARFAIG